MLFHQEMGLDIWYYQYQFFVLEPNGLVIKLENIVEQVILDC